MSELNFQLSTNFDDIFELHTSLRYPPPLSFLCQQKVRGVYDLFIAKKMIIFKKNAIRRKNKTYHAYNRHPREEPFQELDLQPFENFALQSCHFYT